MISSELKKMSLEMTSPSQVLLHLEMAGSWTSSEGESKLHVSGLQASLTAQYEEGNSRLEQKTGTWFDGWEARAGNTPYITLWGPAKRLCGVSNTYFHLCGSDSLLWIKRYICQLVPKIPATSNVKNSLLGTQHWTVVIQDKPRP